VHDFIVTANYVLFPILPPTGSMDRAMTGRPAYAWEPDKGAYIGVMKRGGSAKDIRWFRGDACYVFHTMNAWEEGDLIVADVMDLQHDRRQRHLHKRLSRRPAGRVPTHR